METVEGESDQVRGKGPQWAWDAESKGPRVHYHIWIGARLLT